MRSRYRFTEDQNTYFVTATIVEWIPIFTSSVYCDLIIDSLKFCDTKEKFTLHAWVIMDNHIHLIISGEGLSDGIRDFKSFTAKCILEQLRVDNKTWVLNQFEYYKKRNKTHTNYQVWQEGVHPQAITSEEMFRQKLNYIHFNPVKKGLVDDPVHWIYSSARDYLDS